MCCRPKLSHQRRRFPSGGIPWVRYVMTWQALKIVELRSKISVSIFIAEKTMLSFWIQSEKRLTSCIQPPAILSFLLKTALVWNIRKRGNPVQNEQRWIHLPGSAKAFSCGNLTGYMNHWTLSKKQRPSSFDGLFRNNAMWEVLLCPTNSRRLKQAL